MELSEFFILRVSLGKTVHCLQFQYYHYTVTPQQRTGDSVATQVARWSVSQLDKHE